MEHYKIFTWKLPVDKGKHVIEMVKWADSKRARLKTIVRMPDHKGEHIVVASTKKMSDAAAEKIYEQYAKGKRYAEGEL